MNLHSYSSHYGRFHRCTVSAARNNIIAFDLAYSTYETFILSRMYPYDTVHIDCQKPFMLALKAHFQTDVVASVICNTKYLFTVCLGKEHMIFPTHKDVASLSKLYLYATTYFVKDPKIISQYMQGSIRPAYENVYYYKKTILYLDCYDLPFPGGCYFDDSTGTPYYRILFLTKEPLNTVLELASEWEKRNGVRNIPFFSSDVESYPKFIDFKPISNPIYTDSSMVSAGIIEKHLSSYKPWLLIQDILLSYFKHSEASAIAHLGLIIEWPFCMSYTGAQPPEPSLLEPRFVALTINQNKPMRVLQVRRPYDRYVEYNYVPPGPWTPIYFYMTFFVTSLDVKKVVLDTVVIGVVYRDVFFCFDKPVLEGYPKQDYPTWNTEYLLSTLDFQEDPNVKVQDMFKYNERYALLRVRLKDVGPECWCLMPSENSYPKLLRAPNLIQQWLDFFRNVKDHAFSVDVSIIRLAMMLTKHNICYHMNPDKKKKTTVELTGDVVQFNVDEKTIQFINEARLVEEENVESKICTIS